MEAWDLSYHFLTRMPNYSCYNKIDTVLKFVKLADKIIVRKTYRSPNLHVLLKCLHDSDPMFMYTTLWLSNIAFSCFTTHLFTSNILNFQPDGLPHIHSVIWDFKTSLKYISIWYSRIIDVPGMSSTLVNPL